MNPSALARKAATKIAKFGQHMEYVRESEGPVKPETLQPEVEQTITAFIGMWDNVKAYEASNLVEITDSVIWAGGNVIPVPDSTDWIRVDGTAWDIIHVAPTKPGSQAIIYQLFVRKAGSARGYSRQGK